MITAIVLFSVAILAFLLRNIMFMGAPAKHHSDPNYDREATEAPKPYGSHAEWKS